MTGELEAAHQMELEDLKCRLQEEYKHKLEKLEKKQELLKQQLGEAHEMREKEAKEKEELLSQKLADMRYIPIILLAYTLCYSV